MTANLLIAFSLTLPDLPSGPDQRPSLHGKLDRGDLIHGWGHFTFVPRLVKGPQPLRGRASAQVGRPGYGTPGGKIWPSYAEARSITTGPCRSRASRDMNQKVPGQLYMLFALLWSGTS
jgi:hypothetical protein